MTRTARSELAKATVAAIAGIAAGIYATTGLDIRPAISAGIGGFVLCTVSVTLGRRPRPRRR